MVKVTMSETGVMVSINDHSTIYTRPEYLQALIEELTKCKSLLIESIEKRNIQNDIWEE
jgi:hypothetical protein